MFFRVLRNPEWDRVAKRAPTGPDQAATAYPNIGQSSAETVTATTTTPNDKPFRISRNGVVQLGAGGRA
jgi:hypothetical protein